MTTMQHGTFLTDPRRNDTDKQLAEIRQGVLESLHRTIDDPKSAWMFPGFLVEAVVNEIWAHPRQLAYALAPAMPLLEFVSTLYPRGLWASVEIIEKLIAGDEAAMLAWGRAKQRPDGNPNRDPETGLPRAIALGIPDLRTGACLTG